MRETLTFLHTAAVHVDTFNRLCVEMAPEIPLRHVVDGSLLDAARAAGTVTAALWVRVGEVIAEAERRARVVRFVDRPGRPRSPRRRPTVGC